MKRTRDSRSARKMKRMVSHVVFDFDGTLADSRAVMLSLYNNVACQSGYGLLTPENLDSLRGLSIAERCRALGVPLHRLPGLVMQIARSYRGALDDISLYDDVPVFLASLQESGYRLVVVSTNDEGNIRSILRRHGVEHLFESVTCSHRLYGKARLIRTLLKRRGLRGSQVLYVGDEERDVQASREAGVRVIAVKWGVDTAERLEAARPDAVVSTPAEITAWLDAAS